MSKNKNKKVAKTAKKPEQKKGFFKRILFSYKEIPNKKPYIEFLTALLSVPVLLTVILINLNALRGDKAKTTPTPATEKIFVTVPGALNNSEAKSGEEACKEDIGPIDITSPDEKDTVTTNPVNVTIKYEQGDYCSVVWSYRINGGSWSDYSDNSIALYDLPNGNVKFELRVKSVVNNTSKTLTRNFTYQGNTKDKDASPSAN